MTDPRDYRRDPPADDPRRNMQGGFREDNMLADSRTGVSMWAWIAGIVAAVFIVAIIYGFTNRDSQMAGGNVPPATTGSPTTTTGAGGTTGASGAGSAGGLAPSTTGQGSGTGSGPSGSGGATTSGSGANTPGQPGQGAR